MIEGLIFSGAFILLSIEKSRTRQTIQDTFLVEPT